MATGVPMKGTGEQKHGRFLSFLLSKILSNHGKRVMFVTSLYVRVVRLEKLKAEAIEKLNDVMHLASSQHSLELPALARNFIWKDTDIQNVLNEQTLSQEIPEDQAKELSEQVVDMAPEWLQYSREVMVSDVLSLISKGNQLTCTHA